MSELTLSQVVYTPEQIETIKRTVAVGASDHELAMFITLAQKYQLDPFAKEIWFIKHDGRPVIMTSRDGYLTVANREPTYRGIMSFPVCENDEFEIDAPNYAVKHKMNMKDRGAIVGAWARVEDERKHPFVCYVSMEEYRGNSPVWRKYPSAMIQKVAEAFALKRMYNISGLVTKEELDVDGPVQEPTTAQKVRIEGKTIVHEDINQPVAKSVEELEKKLPHARVLSVGAKPNPVRKEYAEQIEELWTEISAKDPKLSVLSLEENEQMFKAMMKKHTLKDDITKLTQPEAVKLRDLMQKYLLQLTPSITPESDA
jgi:phage recombination protein Bet